MDPFDIPSCGFPLMGSNPTVALKMANNILSSARNEGSEILVHPCSLCHLQLDVTQDKIQRQFKQEWRLPAVYITQLIGLSFGYTPKQLGMSKGSIEYLRSRGIS